jgi:hypothetical protein
MFEEDRLKLQIDNYYSKNKINYDRVIKQLKNKFKLEKCSCCGTKRKSMRYYLGKIKLCSKSCYRYYFYNNDDISFYRDHNT